MPTLRSKTRALNQLDELFEVLLRCLSSWAEGGVDNIEVAQNASAQEKHGLAKEWANNCVKLLQEFISSQKPAKKRKRLATCLYYTHL